MGEGSLSIRQFEFFMTMIVSRNMAEAAETLGVSQAAVSKSLKGLERETGLKLFRNVGGRLQPTAEADRLLPYIQRAMSHFERACSAAQDLRGGDIGQIHVAVAGPPMMSIIPKAVKTFRQRWPDVRIEITSCRTSTLLNRVAGNEVDIGIGTPPVQNFDARLLSMCEVRTVFESPLVAVMPRSHTLANRRFVRATDLADLDLIGLPEDSATTHLINAAFQQAKVVQHRPIVTSIALNGCGLIREGLGIGLMNRLVIPDDLFTDLICVPFAPRIQLRTCTYVPKLNAQTSMVQRFVTCVAEAATELKSRAGDGEVLAP